MTNLRCYFTNANSCPLEQAIFGECVRLTKRAWKTEVDGRRRRGRQTLRRRDSVMRDVERVEVSSREWERMEEDRDDSWIARNRLSDPTLQGTSGKKEG